MNLYSALLSLIVGSGLGILYGLLFLKTKALPLKQEIPQTFWQSTLPSTLRIAALGLIFFYLLRITFIQPILVGVSFLLAFWLMVILYSYYGQY